ncbi:MAG: PQQ-binding-like beta-propeller repeat protein [Phycisphaerae bacterium]|nr:PQQ-binding-like beta-propeller repeat protein [Phycisphaerae bacterium]
MMWGSNGASGTRWRIRLQERDGVGVLKAEINGGNILGCTPVNTGKWVHVRVVLPVGKTNSQDILLFVNGIREPSESVSILPFEIQTASDLDVHIGASLYAGSYFQGRMRDVRISTVSEGDGLGLGNLSIGPDGTVYVGDGSGVLHAVDSAGQLRWKHQTSGMIGGAPAVTGDGKVIFGSVDGTVVALAADGSELWTFAVPGPGTVGGAALASPTIGRDGNIYVGGLYDGKLYALASEDGQVVWTCDFGGGTANPHLSIANAPAVATDGTIYATLINDAKLYAIDPDDGSIVWTANLAGTAGGSFGADYPTRYKEVYPWASPAIGPDGTIYVAFDDPYLRAVNPDGSIRWVTRLGMVGGFVVSVGAGGKIYAAGDDHSLYVLDPEGTILSQFDGSNWLSWPVIGADETLYISDFAGTLWAIAPQPCENKSQRLARPADITLDGKIRLEDLAELAKAWKECTDLLTGSPCLTTGSGWKRIANAIYLSGDIDRDYYVRLSDLLAMADKWMGN